MVLIKTVGTSGIEVRMVCECINCGMVLMTEEWIEWVGLGVSWRVEVDR